LTNVGTWYIFNLMVEDALMNNVFHALAHDARRTMLAQLASGDFTFGELAEPFSMSLEAASKHIRVLERAGLVRRTVEGRRHICTLSPAPLASAYSWLRFYERFWNKRLDALEGLFLPSQKMKGKKRWKGQKR
jgi:DNA-binding transcriptional ArsR family regulator